MAVQAWTMWTMWLFALYLTPAACYNSFTSIQTTPWKSEQEEVYMARAHGFIQEFKKFLSRGNVMDLAVGIIIGTAFTAIVKSLVNDIIMPLIGAIIGGVNFTHLRIIIRKATAERPELALTYGNFLQNVIDFLIIALWCS